MARLAIKGHATRGKEVMEILEMLGGINTYACKAVRETCFYFIVEGEIDYDEERYITDEYTIFTLEEFLEKFPYKVEDKVLLSGVDKIIKQARWDDVNNEVIYKLETNVRGFSEEYYVHHYDLRPYKEETMNRKYDVEEYLKVWKETEKGLEVVVNNRFELKEDNGKFYIIKKQPQYPKTYEECAQILLERASVRNDIGYKGDLLVTLQRLLICRDAYWKIEGWNPQVKGEVFYIPSSLRDLFPMPTAEMRDAFYENFKDLIEQCEELL